MNAAVQPLSHATESNVRARGALRFITCGSVDDGKSTLIGRLLHEAKAIFEDQEAALANDSRKFGTTGEEIDYALLVDGLEAEREQGITIDVAYRFFTTAKRAFIVADTPGHAQYTRNMATGASSAELAILLIDARQGVLDQTRRHAAIVSLLGIRHIVLAVNKMDLVDFDAAVFNKIVADFGAAARHLELADICAIPVSARYGDNITQKSARTPWHKGPALLEYLESVSVAGDARKAPFRFPVQWVNRPNLDFRGVSGTIESGTVALGDEIVIAASGRKTHVQRIVTLDGDLAEAGAGDAVTLVFAEQVDAGRGDMLAHPKQRPDVAARFSAQLVVMSSRGLESNTRLLLKGNSRTVQARIAKILSRTDITTLERESADALAMNDIALVHIETVAPIAFDSYADNRATGAFILIDPVTNETVAAGMIVAALSSRDVHAQASEIDAAARARAKHQTPLTVWLTGLSGSGKSTIASLTEKKLYELGLHAMILDGDNLRLGLNSDLGFSPEDRAENVRRAGEVARLMTQAGLIVLCAFVSPFRADREKVAAMFPDGAFAEVFVDAPLDLCQTRDSKGLYAKAAAGAAPQMTGVGQAYEAPSAPDLILHTGYKSPAQCADELFAFIRRRTAPPESSLDSAQL